MSKELKVILWALLGLFVVIQVIPSGRPPNQPPEGYDFFKAVDAPAEIEQLLRTSCYDCHSEEVDYPWYAYVAPSSWLVSRDVKKGRSKLDFSRWADLSKKEKLKLAGEIADEVEEGAMPLPVYLLMHPNASLDQMEREMIIDWTEALAEKIFEE